MAARMWWYIAVLLGLVILSVIGYFVMIDVKPAVLRPLMGEEARADIQALERRLMEHVRVLGATIGERNLQRPVALRAAAEYIHRVWTEQGFAVAEERYEVLGESCANLVVEHRGVKRPEQIVLVGAHYDSGAVLLRHS